MVLNVWIVHVNCFKLFIFYKVLGNPEQESFSDHPEIIYNPRAIVIAFLGNERQEEAF